MKSPARREGSNSVRTGISGSSGELQALEAGRLVSRDKPVSHSEEGGDGLRLQRVPVQSLMLDNYTFTTNARPMAAPGLQSLDTLLTRCFNYRGSTSPAPLRWLVELRIQNIFFFFFINYSKK